MVPVDFRGVRPNVQRYAVSSRPTRKHYQNHVQLCQSGPRRFVILRPSVVFKLHQGLYALDGACLLVL